MVVTSTIQPMALLPRKGIARENRAMSAMAAAGICRSFSLAKRSGITASLLNAKSNRLRARMLPIRLVMMSASNTHMSRPTPKFPR